MAQREDCAVSAHSRSPHVGIHGVDVPKMLPPTLEEMRRMLRSGLSMLQKFADSLPFRSLRSRARFDAEYAIVRAAIIVDELGDALARGSAVPIGVADASEK